MAVFGLSMISMLAITVVMTQKQWDQWKQDCRPGSSCYKFIDKEDIWTSAVQYCEGFDWQLVEIEDLDELKFIQEKIRLHFGMQASKDVEFWTAGTQNSTDKQWRWYHGGIGVNGKMWAPPEPNSKGTEVCIGLYNKENYYLNDDNCFRQIFWVCEGKKLVYSGNCKEIQ